MTPVIKCICTPLHVCVCVCGMSVFLFMSVCVHASKHACLCACLYAQVCVYTCRHCLQPLPLHAHHWRLNCHFWIWPSCNFTQYCHYCFFFFFSKQCHCLANWMVNPYIPNAYQVSPQDCWKLQTQLCLNYGAQFTLELILRTLLITLPKIYSKASFKIKLLFFCFFSSSEHCFQHVTSSHKPGMTADNVNSAVGSCVCSTTGPKHGTNFSWVRPMAH